MHHGKTSKCINSYVATLVFQSGGAIIHHTDINPDPALFHSDGVHLSPLGNYIFLNSLQGGLEAIVVHGHSNFAALPPLSWRSSLARIFSYESRPRELVA